MEPLGFSDHDHHSCIMDGVTKAQAHCTQNGLQLTPARKRVLEILLKEHRAMGAYEILDVLRAEGLGAQPPVAYRALDFLVSNGFAHKIERLNAFIACAHPGTTHVPAFMICRVCDSVAESETDTANSSLGDTARAAGFQIERVVLEISGVCPNCQDAA